MKGYSRVMQVSYTQVAEMIDTAEDDGYELTFLEVLPANTPTQASFGGSDIRCLLIFEKQDRAADKDPS